MSFKKVTLVDRHPDVGTNPASRQSDDFTITPLRPPQNDYFANNPHVVLDRAPSPSPQQQPQESYTPQQQQHHPQQPSSVVDIDRSFFTPQQLKESPQTMSHVTPHSTPHLNPLVSHQQLTSVPLVQPTKAELQVDQVFSRFVEDIVKRYLENNLNRFVKSIKPAARQGKRTKKSLETNKITLKKKKQTSNTRPLILSNKTNKVDWIFK